MKKLKKIVAGILGVMVMICSASNTAWATATSSRYSLPALPAGSWWSGFGNGQLASLTASNIYVYEGDVGMYFYMTGVGLSSAFVPASGRTVEIQLMEGDEGDNASETAGTYRGYFNYNSSGDYAITRFFQDASGSECIETNNIVELYIRAKVNTVSGDTSIYVPANLFQYEMWVN